MENDSLLNHMYVELDKKSVYLQNEILKGNLKDFAEYRNLCGQLRGLHLAMELMDEVARKEEMEESNDE